MADDNTNKENVPVQPTKPVKKLSAIERQRRAHQEEMQRLVIKEQERVTRQNQNFAATGKRIANEPDPESILSLSPDVKYIIVSYVSAHERDPNNGVLSKSKYTFQKVRGAAATLEEAREKAKAIGKIDPDFENLILEIGGWQRVPPNPVDIAKLPADYNQPELKAIMDQYYARAESERNESARRAKEMQRVANEKARAAGIDIDAFKSDVNHPNHPLNMALHIAQRDIITIDDAKLAQIGRGFKEMLQQIRVQTSADSRRLQVMQLEEKLHSVETDLRLAPMGQHKVEDLARALNGLAGLLKIVQEKLKTDKFIIRD